MSSANAAVPFVETNARQSGRRALRICMIGYAFYESDTRILQYATALAKRGDQVDVIALKRDDTAPAIEVLDGVRVHRIQTRKVNEKGLFAYGSRIFRFALHSMFYLRKLNRTKAYDVVHVHNVPDLLVFSALFAKFKDIPVILDIHDLLPEFYASKFGVKNTSVIFRFMVLLERLSARFATHLIIANHLWRDRLAARSSSETKCSVVRNHPDLDIFTTSDPIEKSKPFLLTYPGSLNAHQGLDVAIRAFALISDQIPDAEFHIYGEGPAKPSLISTTRRLGLEDRIIFHDFLPSREIARVMAATDLAIEPKMATSSFGNEALSTKILEFMALGVPVIASKTKIHAYYYDDSIIQYYENDDPAELAKQIVRLKNDPKLRSRMAANAKDYVRRNTWEARQQDYLTIVDSFAHRYA
jgi:glycosyltransferase involved in cell wall biosynthesis